MAKNRNKETCQLPSEKLDRAERVSLLGAIGVEDRFENGNMTINWKTCRGVECRLCIDACPTSALYWMEGEVGMAMELCVYCGACVGVCIVDDCIEVCRQRRSGEIESFSNATEIQKLLRKINNRKAVEIVKSRLPDVEAYFKRYG
jgi:NAD-dependent dihydropyrimidine dehydrogenase PreA subunit